MADWTTRALFLREFHWRRPESAIGFGAKPLRRPQTFPRDFIAAAIRSGAAIPVQKRRAPHQTATPEARPKAMEMTDGSAHH